MAHNEDFNLDIETVSPFEVSETKLVRPRIIKQRINNQSGVFSIPSSEELIRKRDMNENPVFNQKLIKVKISSACLSSIRTDLNTLGVNAFTIFPELEGLCTFAVALF
ncbi:MAG: hypothetical protein K0S09_1668 [Sphingobacteriaceae bacterium]|jgi:hypothetical protein|nr:hypothetical protein [Sphingobacteriaceae bacterium]